MNRHYPEEGFSFERYVAEAYEGFNFRLDEKNDGELSFALATIMAWDRVMRGLIHWERLGRKDSLYRVYSLPVTTVSKYPYYLFPGELEELRNQMKLLELVPGLKRGLRLVNLFSRRFPRAKKMFKRMLQYLHMRV